MKRLLLILLICLIANAEAHVPGYMGKRVYVSYSNLYSISIPFYPINETGPTHCLGLHFITGKKTEFSISANYFGSKVENDILLYSSHQSISYYDNSIYTFDGFYSSERVNSFGGSIALKIYRKDRFAPIGPYFKWEIIFYEDQLKIRPYSVSYYNYTTGNTVSFDYGGVKKIISAGAGFGFGKQKVLNDKIVIDVGLRGALVYSSGNASADTRYEQEIVNRVFEKVLAHESINLRLGIGFLAF